jgi:hypothetical protein
MVLQQVRVGGGVAGIAASERERECVYVYVYVCGGGGRSSHSYRRQVLAFQHQTRHFPLPFVAAVCFVPAVPACPVQRRSRWMWLRPGS